MAKLDYVKDPIWGAHAVRHHMLQRLRRPEARARASRFLARFRPRPDTPDARSQARCAELVHDGFVMLSDTLPQDLLARARDRLIDGLCTDGYRPALGAFPLSQAPADSNVLSVVESERIPEVMQIANHPAILQVVAHYLGCKPIINDIEAWWSVPNGEGPKEAQFFHRDNDAIRFVKLFIYLTDVTEEDGPHVFVRGSHRTDTLLQAGVRLTDDQVAAAHSPADIVRFTGPFGTVFLEDTYGIHKGEFPRRKPRLILQVRYTLMPSMFVKRHSKGAPIRGFDPYVNRWFRAEP